MKNMDEDYCYGLWKQKQIDSSPKVIIGKDIPLEHKIQRTHNFDPNPHIPFVEPKFPRMTLAEAVLYGCGWGFAIGAIVFTEWAK